MAKGLEVERAVGGAPFPAASAAGGAGPVERDAPGRMTERRDHAVGPAAAAACAGARGPDGLTAAERRAVASDSSAPPALPPAVVPPRPEPVRAALGKMLDHVELEGGPVDLATLASAVRRPQGEAGGPPRRPGAARSGGATCAGSDGSSHAGSSVAPSLAAALAATQSNAAARLAVATRGAPGAPAATGCTPSGATGGVDGATPFDAMRFNWDAFFARFLLRATADAQAWRKLAGELRHRAARTGIVMQQADTELLELRQALERAQALRPVAESMVRVAGARAGTGTEPGATEGDSAAAAGERPDRARRVAGAITAAVDELPGSAEGIAGRAARRAVVLARADRDRLDALVRERMGRAQGMLAQLARLLGGSRGG